MPPHAVDLAAPAERVRRMAEEVLGAEADPADPTVLVVAVRFPTGDPTPGMVRWQAIVLDAGTKSASPMW